MTSTVSFSCAAAMAAAVPAFGSIAAAAVPIDENQAHAIQVLADVTLIDAQCGTMNTNFGVAFRYAEDHGVRSIDVMPLGRHRAEFQAAYDQRLHATSREDLCGPIAQQYSQNLPGLFAAR